MLGFSAAIRSKAAKASLVAAELDERVAEDAVRRSARRAQLRRPARPSSSASRKRWREARAPRGRVVASRSSPGSAHARAREHAARRAGRSSGRRSRGPAAGRRARAGRATRRRRIAPRPRPRAAGRRLAVLPGEKPARSRPAASGGPRLRRGTAARRSTRPQRTPPSSAGDDAASGATAPPSPILFVRVIALLSWSAGGGGPGLAGPRRRGCYGVLGLRRPVAVREPLVRERDVRERRADRSGRSRSRRRRAEGRSRA